MAEKRWLALRPDSKASYTVAERDPNDANKVREVKGKVVSVTFEPGVPMEVTDGIFAAAKHAIGAALVVCKPSKDTPGQSITDWDATREIHESVHGAGKMSKPKTSAVTAGNASKGSGGLAGISAEPIVLRSNVGKPKAESKTEKPKESQSPVRSP